MSASKSFLAMAINFRGKYDPCVSTDIWLTNQHILDPDEIPEYYPILESISGVGVQMDEFTPKFRQGTVRLINSKDTISFQKRLTDLACSFAFINAKVIIYSACVDVKDETFFQQKEIVWQGIIENIEYNSRNQEVSQRVSIRLNKPQEEHTVTRQLNKIDFPEIAERAVNKWMPLVFGQNRQVVPYAVDINPEVSTGFSGIPFAYATVLDQDPAETPSRRCHNQGIQRILMSDPIEEDQRDKVYKEILGLASDAPPAQVYGQNNTGVPVATPNLNRPIVSALPYLPGASDRYAVSTFGFITGPNGDLGASGVPDGEIIVRLHRQRQGAIRPTPHSEFLAEATIFIEDYAALLAQPVLPGNGFVMQCVFNRIIPICHERYTYWVSIQASGQDNPANIVPISIQQPDPDTPAGALTYTTTDEPTADNQEPWIPHPDPDIRDNVMAFAFNPVTFEDQPGGPLANDSFNENGLGYSRVVVRYPDLTFAHPTGAKLVDDITRIDFLLEINGLEDTDGAITGTVGQLLNTPPRQLDALFSEYDGSKWTQELFSQTRFSDTHDQYTMLTDEFFRFTAGRTFGQASNLEVIEEIARNSYSIVVYDGFGDGDLYSCLAVGRTRDPVAIFNDNNALIERWFINDINTIVNHLDMNFDRRLDDRHFQANADQVDFADYGQTAIFNPRIGIGQTFSQISNFHYKEKRLRNQNFDWISGPTSANSVGELFLRLHDHPYEYAQVDIDWCEFKDLKMFDVVRVFSTELPNISGTSADEYEIDCNCEIIGSSQVMKTKPYLGEIVAMTFNQNRRAEGTLKVLVRLLVHVNDPLHKYTPTNLGL